MPFLYQPTAAKRQNKGGNHLAKYTNVYEDKHWVKG